MNTTQRMNPPNGRMEQSDSPSMSERISNLPGQMGECMTDCVDERPLASVAAAFGVGLIAGVGLVALYCQMQPSNSMSSMASSSYDSLSNSLSKSYDSLAKRISDAVTSALPQSLSGHWS